MKYNDIENTNIDINQENFENIFNIYENEDNLYFYNILRTIYIPTDLDPEYYTEYSIKTNDTWFLISYNFYGTVKLWWLICNANNILNPFIDFPEGSVIKVIKKEYISNILNKISE